MNGLKGLILIGLTIASAIALNAQFAEVTNTGIPSVYARAVDWGDYDNDGDLDLVLIGENPNNVGVTKLCRNNGDNTFTEVNSGLVNIADGAVSWGDYDNDGDLDIIIIGSASTSLVSKVYRNDLNDTFTDIGAVLAQSDKCSIAWGDIDNDGDLDIIVSGAFQTPDSGYDYDTKIYRNNGNDSFSEILLDLPGEANSSLKTGDLDQDGDLDFIITGGLNFGNKLFTNNGNSTFTVSQINLSGTIATKCDLGDYDNDGDLDLVIGSNQNREMQIFFNDGDGFFVNTGYVLWVGVCTSVSWGDYDNDGDLDILYTGSDPIIDQGWKTLLVRNDGDNVFVDVPLNIQQLHGQAAWGDFDNDGDLDFILTGLTTVGINPVFTFYSNLILNYTANQNSEPMSPVNLSVLNDYTTTEFLWDIPTDDNTPSLGLNYVLKIGTSPEDCLLSTPMSNTNGYRLIPARGYVGSNCSWKIKRSALPDLFYWSVQAIDTAFQGSAFAPVQEVSFLPRIALLSAPSISFGSVPVEGTSDWVSVTFKNTSLADIDIDSVHFYVPDSQFELNYPHSGLPLAAGASDTLLIRFAPLSPGAISDTLYIESNAVNKPVIKISLFGTGIHVPPQTPDNLGMGMTANSVTLTWDPVTETIFHTPITPDYYFIFNSIDPYGTYYLLGVTPDLTYIHNLVGIGAQRMFYRVVAYKNYGRSGLDPADILKPGMTAEEVLRLLNGATHANY